jgi:aryl-alcohol dehydrogenase-like predicted oxidoreductase
MQLIKKKELGKTGIYISEIGFGTWGISGDWGRQIPKQEIFGTYKLAIDAGINFFDTAAVYGNGFAEQTIGEMQNESIIVLTKIPALTKPKEPIQPFPYYYPTRHIVKRAQESAQRLNRKIVDILLLHNWNPAWNKNASEYLRPLLKLKEARKVNAIGVSIPNWMDSSINELLEKNLVDCVELPLNLFQQWAIEKIIKKAKDCGVGVLARSPLDHGSLGTLLERVDSLPQGDFRKKEFSGSQKETLASNLDRITSETGIKREELSAYALRFVLNQPGTTSAIVGFRSQATVLKTIKDYGKHFSREKLFKGKKFVWKRNPP